MREITQPSMVRCRMVQQIGGVEHRCTEGGEPDEQLRASAVALPFVALALVVAGLLLITR